jgi:hypothetical protein
MPTPEELEHMSEAEVLALARRHTWRSVAWGVAGLVLTAGMWAAAIATVPVLVIAGVAGLYLLGKGAFDLAQVAELERPLDRDDKKED